MLIAHNISNFFCYGKTFIRDSNVTGILTFDCHNEINKQKLLLKPPISLDYGKSTQIMTNGLITEFKKIESDSFALIFFLESDSTEVDSLNSG